MYIVSIDFVEKVKLHMGIAVQQEVKSERASGAA
jgi:hypothetical protein